jgi:transcription antitermination factor NusG
MQLQPLPSWLALSVRSRHEKSVKRILDYKGYTTSLPLRTRSHTRRCGTDWQSATPLIPGYVFVLYELRNSFHIATTPGVIRFVAFGNGPSPIPAVEIEALERITASNLPIGECGYTRAGDEVELLAGPLKGLTGLVVREAGNTRLVVSVSLLQRSVFVEIESKWAGPVSPSVSGLSHRPVATLSTSC